MKRSNRKLITAAAALLLTASSYAAKQDATYNFRVLLDDKPIGFHQFELSHNKAEQEVESEARFDVKLLFITAFKYRHSSFETWSDNCVTSIDAKTSSNGKRQNVKGERVDDVLELDSSVGEKRLNGCVQTFAYWNPDILDADRLLNSQTGDYVDVIVTSLGPDDLTLGGVSVEAVKYKIESVPDYSGKPVDITLWYDATKTTWLALESVAKGDRKLRYELETSPTAQTSEISAAIPGDQR